jgi:hypothetical protein
MINKNWVFGNGAGLNFGTIPNPTPTSGFAIATNEGCASISDSNGNLLLYTDGTKVWDSTNPVPKATGLLGHSSSTQSAIIVPDPSNGQQYYIFTVSGASTGVNNHFNGIRINVSSWTHLPLASLMTLPSTTGRSPTEKVIAIQHANCVDYWVLTIVQQSPTLAEPNALGIFRVFLVNSLGVQYIGETAMNRNVGDIGYLKGSPNGRRLAVANHPNDSVLLCNFDNALGVIDIPSLVVIPVPGIASFVPPIPTHQRIPYGVEFSPNSDVLYYSLLGNSTGSGSDNNGYIFQVDLTAPTPVSTQVVVYANVGGGDAIGALQLGMDGRIYVAKQGETSLGAILTPNKLGGGVTGCDPNMGLIALMTGTTCQLGLPNLLPNKCPCACEAGPCEGDVNAANQVLDARAGLKQFTIVANGQTMPTTCNLAFDNVNFGPVFTLKWGDGPSDQFESEDFEVIYILVHNPFRNLIYRNLMIFDITIMPNQTLPSGEDAVTIIPAEIACFEEVQPCSHVARDFALVLDHCLVGTYQIAFKYCIEEIAIVSATKGNAVFKINVVAS